MKTKHTFWAALFLLFSLTTYSQTKIIAHKSHSGKASTFNIHSVHNFGLGPMISTDTVIHVSDSIFVAVMSEYLSKKTWKDTVEYSATNKNYYLQHIFLGKSLEELKSEMPSTVFIGFEKEDEQTPPIHYFYPRRPNANPDYHPSTQPKQNSNQQSPVKNN